MSTIYRALKKPFFILGHPPKWMAGIWLFGMIIIFVLASQLLKQDWLETGFLALLPKSEQRPEIARAMQSHHEQLNRKLIWLTGAATSQQAIDHAFVLKQTLEQSGLFKEITLQFSKQAYIDRYRALFPYRYQLLDAQTQAILIQDPNELIKQNMEILHSPLGQMQAGDLEHDPFLLFSRYFSAQNPIQFNLEQGIVVLADGHRSWALLLSDLQDERLKLDKLEVLLSLVHSSTEQIKTSGGALLVSGMALFTAQGAHSAQQEISIVGIGSSLGVIILMLIVFRSIKPVLLSSLAIGCGLLAAFAICVLVFGKVHIMTLVFGVGLIGVADDYAQHFLCDSLGETDWDPQKSLVFILPGLTWGLLSNLACYAGLGFSPFPGLQEVALFSAVGLLVAWLTVVLLFPLLLTRFKFDHGPRLLKLTDFWQKNWPLWVFRHARRFGLILAAFIVSGLWMLKPQDDVRLLQAAPPELTRMAEKIRALFPMSPENQFFWVSGVDQADWYRNEQRLVKALEALKQQKALSFYQGLSLYWPDEALQWENYRLLKQSLYESGLLERYMTELGFDDKAVRQELKQFAQAEHSTLSLAEWLSLADEARQSLWLGCNEGLCQSRVILTGIVDGQALKALQALPGIVWVDQVEQLSSLFERYRIRASGLLLFAFCLASGGLCFKFGWRNGLTLMSVPVLSLTVSLAMLGWFNQLFSLFNLFALLLVLGIGVDYSLFFFIAGERRCSTSLGVTLSALTTLLAFGLLATSSTEMVHAFGFTVTVGIVTALMCAPLIGFRRQERGSM